MLCVDLTRPGPPTSPHFAAADDSEVSPDCRSNISSIVVFDAGKSEDQGEQKKEAVTGVESGEEGGVDGAMAGAVAGARLLIAYLASLGHSANVQVIGRVEDPERSVPRTGDLFGGVVNTKCRAVSVLARPSYRCPGKGLLASATSPSGGSTLGVMRTTPVATRHAPPKGWLGVWGRQGGEAGSGFRSDTSVSSAAANFGEVGGPGLVKSTHTTSPWCPQGPLVASAAKGANDVCGVLGAPGASVVAVVERAAALSSSDDREDRLVGPQAAGFLLTTGERVVGRRNKINMDSSIIENNVNAPGDLGAPGAGAGVVVKQATPASLSDDCGARLVDHQASGALTATGEGRGSNTPSEAVPGLSGPARPMTGGAPMVRLRRLPDGLVRCSSSRSIDRVV
ncbi:hypothetical protein WN55_06833, partial [Dufourea novaeangliae]